VSNTLSEKEFLERFAPVVYNLALRLVGNPVDAEDLAQDALLKSLKALPGFRGESQVSTCIYRIAVNTWKNRVRSEKRRGLWNRVSPRLFAGEDHGEEREPAAADPPLDTGLEAEEKEAVVQKALLRLDEESRAVVVLREIEGQSYEQIAAALQIPEGTVKSRLYRAREALRAKLGGYVIS